MSDEAQSPEAAAEKSEWTRIWAPQLAEVHERVAKTNKRCEKLGLPTMTLVEGKSWTERRVIREEEVPACKAPVIKEDDHFIAVLEFVEVKVTGEAPKLSGWALIARVEAFPGGQNLLHCVPGVGVPTEFRTRDANDCDHCHTHRVRKDTYVVRHEDGTYKMVGRNCIADFLGHQNPNDILWLFNQYMRVLSEGGEAGEEWMGGHGGGVNAAELKEVLAVTAAKVEDSGFVSKKAAETKTVQPTADAVMAHYTQTPTKDYDPRIQFNDTHMEIADKVIAWVRANTEVSDYLNNLRTMFSVDYAKFTHLGYICSAVSAYNRAMGIEDLRMRKGAEWAAKIAQSTHVGTVGKREDFEVLVVSTQNYDSDFGTKTLVKMEDRAGNTLVWWAANLSQELGAGSWYTVKATVKAHGDYKGLKQTTITRAKVLGQIKGGIG